MQARYLVGIDLGTTHTVVAYADLTQGQVAAGFKPTLTIERFFIPQLTAPGEIAPRPLLPSVRYHPAEGELARESLELPWPQPDIGDPVPTPIIGELARKLGAKSQGRLVVSAKSWLCNPNVERTADILPWGAASEVPKVSPLIACASYLAHVRGAWNFKFPDHPLEQQEVVVTIPASFDEDARALTVKAARITGLSNLHLVEEPQAVCYDWLYRHRADLGLIADSRLLLVVDIGGGTTDLTLIRIEPAPKLPKLTRIGVGEHLLLGGDNIDLALAHLAEERLLGPQQSDRAGFALRAAEFSQLVESCRLAKERLLAAKSSETATVSLLGSGARLIGGARTVTLSREEVHSLVLEGFFPRVSLDEHPQGKRSGLVEFGLPYAADPAVTRHIAAFLRAHARTAREALGDPETPPVPDTVLLNGGVFLSPAITRRLLEVIGSWRSAPILALDNPHPEFAVAAGAVAYAMARRGFGPKIGGGAARSYFLVVEGERGKPQGVCLLPRGTEEAQEILLKERVFALRLGQPVRFHLVSSTEASYQPGEVVPLDHERLDPLPPVVTVLAKGERGEVKVHLAARMTEIGTLELECVAEDGRRFKLDFELRRKPSALFQDASHPHLAQAQAAIERYFGKKSKEVVPTAVKTLSHELEKLLGPRHRWDAPLLRELADGLLEGNKSRRRSAEHERTWFSLAGFCLRPGFGYPLDDWRIDQVRPLYSQGLQFVHVIQNWAEWWTFWRRIAGGLDQPFQQAIFAELCAYLDPARAKKPEVLKQRSYENIIRLAAVLEQLKPEDKIRLGEWLLERLTDPKEPEEILVWALGRLGTRVPFYASSHCVIPNEVAENWLRRLLDRPSKLKGFGLALLARRASDRTRDIDPALRAQVVEKLKRNKAPASWIRMVNEAVELSSEDQKHLLGEALPPGLKLLA